jgi:transglutaminase-like putative cysteine protease
MRKLFLPVLAVACTIGDVKAQDDRNIVIRNATEEYSFVKGNAANPVRIREKINTVYLCNDYRTDIQVADFFNDQTEINDVDIRVNGSKAKYIPIKKEYYSEEGIFFSDTKVCYFTLPFEKKGSTSEVTLEKTIQDPRYFTSIYFTEPYEVRQKDVVLTIPSWMKAEVKEYNFEGYTITKKLDKKSDADVYTYTISNARPYRSEKNAPGPTFLAPHLLVLSKYAEPDGTRITYFSTLDDQYKWYRDLVKQIGNDQAAIKEKAIEITKGQKTEMDKVKALFLWVQDNVRYIAFEDGLAGFRPEKAQEVLRKKYGDCKGMGNLMAEMLRAIGLDGRKCWLGTNHIAHDYSTPSLGVDNHMISAWIYQGKTYFLDPTEKYIGFGETAERIQGRQVLIENGDSYLLQKIPLSNELQNTSREKRTLTISGTNLVGHVEQTWKGESKEWLLSGFHQIKKDRQEDVLKQYLSEGNANYQISNIKMSDLSDYNSDLKIEYDLVFRDAVTAFDKELYLDIDNRKDFSQFRFDTLKRRLPYVFPFKSHIIFDTEIVLPANAKTGALPAPVKVDQPMYQFEGSWSNNGNRLVYHREMQLRKTLLPLSQFASWNHDISKLDEFYSNTITLSLQ